MLPFLFMMLNLCRLSNANFGKFGYGGELYIIFYRVLINIIFLYSNKDLIIYH